MEKNFPSEIKFFSIYFKCNGSTPSKMSCIISGIIAPSATLKYNKDSNADHLFIPKVVE
jgi:hypothetical protein